MLFNGALYEKVKPCIPTQARQKRCGMAAVAAPKICREGEREREKEEKGGKKKKRGERKRGVKERQGEKSKRCI